MYRRIMMVGVCVVLACGVCILIVRQNTTVISYTYFVPANRIDIGVVDEDGNPVSGWELTVVDPVSGVVLSDCGNYRGPGSLRADIHGRVTFEAGTLLLAGSTTVVFGRQVCRRVPHIPELRAVAGERVIGRVGLGMYTRGDVRFVLYDGLAKAISTRQQSVDGG